MARKDARDGQPKTTPMRRRIATPGAQQPVPPPEGGISAIVYQDGSMRFADGHTVPGPLGTYQGNAVSASLQAAWGYGVTQGMYGSVQGMGSSNGHSGGPGVQHPYPDMEKVPQNKPLLQSMGATGTAIPSGIITSEEYNPDFFWRDAIALYEQMSRSEGQASAITYILELPIRRATPAIEPFSDDPADKEIASFVESCLFHDLTRTTATGRVVHQTWDDVLRHILMMLRYGFSAFEQVWRVEDGWVKWAQFLPLLPRTIWRWWVGEDSELEGIQQWTWKGYSYRYIDIPADKLLLFVHRMEGQNYEGVSLFRAAYQHWYYKQQYYRIQAIDIERNAVSVPVITLPEGFTAADISAAQLILANLRANEQMGVTKPPGWGLEYLRNWERTSTQVQPAIDHHDVMMARSVLAQFINLGSTETGAFALDASQKATLLAALQAECEYIEDVFNADAIPRLVDYNYSGVSGYPRLKFGKVVSQDFDAIAGALQKLVNMPTPLLHPDLELEDYLRNELGLPKAPRSVVEGYNPTSPDNSSQPTAEVGNGGAGGEDENGTATNTGRGSAKGQSNLPEEESDDGGADGGKGADGGGGGGGGGGALSELRSEAQLLREALAAARQWDAVDRGMTFGGTNPYRDARGRYAAGPHAEREGEGEGEGHAEGFTKESFEGGAKGSKGKKAAADPKAKAAEKAATLRRQVDERMAAREALYKRQHELLEEKGKLESQQRDADWTLQSAAHAVRIALYRESLDKSNPEVKRYLKDVAARETARENGAKAQEAQQKAEALLEHLGNQGKKGTDEYAQAKAAYDQAVKEYEAAQKAENKARDNIWTKSPSVYKPEFDSVAGVEYHLPQMGLHFTAQQIAAHPLMVAARAELAAVPKRLKVNAAELAALEPQIKTANTAVNRQLGQLRRVHATLGSEGEARDTMRPFNDVLPLPEGHQPPNALMLKMDYQMHEPRAVTKSRIIDNIATRLKGNEAWQEYVSRAPTPRLGELYHDYVPEYASARDTKSAQLVADWIKKWGVGYRPGSAEWVSMQKAVRDEFGLDATIHSKAETQKASLNPMAGTDAKGGAAERFYAQNGAALRSFMRAMYDNTQHWFREQGISELEVYRGFHWDKKETEFLPKNITWGESEHPTHGVTDVELNPFQSFSADINISQGTSKIGGFGGGFAGAHDDYSLLVGAKVPVDRVLSTAQTGFGAKLESEIVVMGRATDTMAYRASTRVPEALQRQAHEEQVGDRHKLYTLPDGTKVHVTANADGTHTVTYAEGPHAKIGGRNLGETEMKLGASKTYKTVAGVNKLLKSVRIANTYVPPTEEETTP